MADRFTIQYNYNVSISKADRLDELANDLRLLAKNGFESTIYGVSKNWNGESATKFIKKSLYVQEDILKQANRLSKTASAIRCAANNIRNAEMRALEIAENTDNNY